MAALRTSLGGFSALLAALLLTGSAPIPGQERPAGADHTACLQRLPPTPGDLPSARLWVKALAACIMGEEAKEYRTDRFSLVADHPSPQAPNDMLDNLRLFRAFYVETLGELVELSSRQERVEVYYFAYPGGFERFLLGLGYDSGTAEGVAGVFVPGLDFLAFDGAAVIGGESVETLIHEATHLYNSKLLFEGHRVPFWIEEGLASYFAGTRMKKKKFQFLPGKIRKPESRIITEDADTAMKIDPRDGHKHLSRRQMVLEIDPREPLRRAIMRYEAGDLIEISDLIALESGHAAPDLRWIRSAYVESWALVHLMLHGSGGEFRPRLGAYLRRARDGQSDDRAFRKSFTSDPDALEPLLFYHMQVMLDRH